jgi:DNA replication protein DnaC
MAKSDSAHGVGKRFRAATLSQVNSRYFTDIFRYADNYEKYLKRGEGLLLSGPPGIGKTFAMVALQKHIKEKMGGRFDYYVVTAPRLFELYATPQTAAELDEHRGKTWSRLFEDVEGMVINDLGKEERIREWQEQAAAYKLGRLLRARHEEERPIFITTNFPILGVKDDDSVLTFQKAYGDSIWSLLLEMTAIRAQVQSPDLREKKARRALEALRAEDEAE